MDTRLKHLYEAAYVGDVNYLNMLLEEDRLLLDRVVTATEANENPLHIAALLGHTAFAREVLRRKPKLAREFNGQHMSPLHLAAAQGHFQVVEELLQVDVDLCNLQEKKEGYLPVHIAVIKGRHDLVSLLIEKCEGSLSEVTYRSETLLHLAIKASCIETIEYFAARGDTQVMLNAKDINGNTCLHLAFAGRQQQVIKHLLCQENIDVNPVNSAGLTPFDVLLVTNHEIGDLYLAEMIRAAGGKTAKELVTSETDLTNSISMNVDKSSEARVLSTQSNQPTRTQKKSSDINENNLMVVATLVATVTFAAALNPPGGTIQMPFDEKDFNNTAWLRKWEDVYPNSNYPAGRPVFLWDLEYFFMYDYFALSSSINVILFCLLGVARQSTALMNLLRLGVWCSILFMVLAYNSALYVLLYDKQNDTIFRWFNKVSYLWSFGFALTAAGLPRGFITSLMEIVLRGVKRLAPSWMGSRETKGKWKKIKKVISVIFFVAIGAFVGWYIGLLVYDITSE